MIKILYDPEKARERKKLIDEQRKQREEELERSVKPYNLAVCITGVFFALGFICLACVFAGFVTREIENLPSWVWWLGGVSAIVTVLAVGSFLISHWKVGRLEDEYYEQAHRDAESWGVPYLGGYPVDVDLFAKTEGKSVLNIWVVQNEKNIDPYELWVSFETDGGIVEERRVCNLPVKKSVKVTEPVADLEKGAVLIPYEVEQK